jgi:acetyltransferase-like isoleucine patch superfamily enzyme
MNIWERHGFIEAPFYALGAVLRRVAETVRLAYWRAVFGWNIGRGVRVHWTVHIPRKLKVRLGDGAVLGRKTYIIAELRGGALEIGPNTNVEACLLDVSGPLTIGANSTISRGAAIYTHSHGRNPKNSPTAYPISIGDRVWICSNAIVLSSTKTVGDGAIVGPSEVVREPVPENEMVVRKGKMNK